MHLVTEFSTPLKHSIMLSLKSILHWHLFCRILQISPKMVKKNPKKTHFWAFSLLNFYISFSDMHYETFCSLLILVSPFWLFFTEERIFGHLSIFLLNYLHCSFLILNMNIWFINFSLFRGLFHFY